MAQQRRHSGVRDPGSDSLRDTNVCLSKTRNQLLQRHATSDIYSNCKSLWIKASAK